MEQHSHLKLLERSYVAAHMPGASPEQQSAQDDLLQKTATPDNVVKMLRAFHGSGWYLAGHSR
jgi:hypothetical protein